MAHSEVNIDASWALVRKGIAQLQDFSAIEEHIPLPSDYNVRRRKLVIPLGFK